MNNSIFVVTKPKSAKTVITTIDASIAIEAVATMIMIGPYLQEDIIDNQDKNLLINKLDTIGSLKIKTCQGYFKIESMDLIGEQTTAFTVENMRQMYCMQYDTFLKVFEMANDDYASGKFRDMMQDMGKYLCNLDNGRQAILSNFLNS